LNGSGERGESMRETRKRVCAGGAVASPRRAARKRIRRGVDVVRGQKG
jgi:hypothetical protein